MSLRPAYVIYVPIDFGLGTFWTILICIDSNRLWCGFAHEIAEVPPVLSPVIVLGCLGSWTLGHQPSGVFDSGFVHLQWFKEKFIIFVYNCHTSSLLNNQCCSRCSRCSQEAFLQDVLEKLNNHDVTGLSRVQGMGRAWEGHRWIKVVAVVCFRRCKKHQKVSPLSCSPVHPKVEK
jgi:hypothetical protein